MKITEGRVRLAASDVANFLAGRRLTQLDLLRARDGRLAVAGPEPGSWRFPLSLTSDPEVFTIDPDSPQAGDQVRFHCTADGRVGAISLFDATFARLDPVVAG